MQKFWSGVNVMNKSLSLLIEHTLELNAIETCSRINMEFVSWFGHVIILDDKSSLKLFFCLFKSQNFKLVTVGLWSGDPVGKSKQHWLQSSANLFFFFTFLVFIHSESSLSSSSFLSPLSSAAVVLVVVFVVVDDVVVVDVDHKSRRHFLLFKTNKQILQFLEKLFSLGVFIFVDGLRRLRRRRSQTTLKAAFSLWEYFAISTRRVTNVNVSNQSSKFVLYPWNSCKKYILKLTEYFLGANYGADDVTT